MKTMQVPEDLLIQNRNEKLENKIAFFVPHREKKITWEYLVKVLSIK